MCTIVASMSPPPRSSTDRETTRTNRSAQLHTLAENVGRQLTPREFSLHDGIRIAVDGADGDPPNVLVQCAQVRGQLKSSHRNKVIADAFKLMWLRDSVYPEAQALLALSPEFTRLLSPGAWLPTALEHWRIHVVIVAPENGDASPIPGRDHEFTDQ
ncbi:hypothetical protein GCM10027590_20920 [Nocardiopsis nanhaiensis]